MDTILRESTYATAIAWLVGRGAQIVLLLVLLITLRSATRRIVPRVIRTAVLKSAPDGDAAELAKRYTTVSDVAARTFETILWIVFAFMVLSQLGLDISPVIAGVGVAGIAIGFGAQSLVKDILAGLFIILENQYGKGDVVNIAGIGGSVEDVNLRRTILRDLDGTVHSVPNGEVRVSSNLTRDWSRVNLSVIVSYEEDLDRAMAVINAVGEELAADTQFGPLIVEAPKALRVDSFDDLGIAIRMLGVTKPIKQWEVTGELRRRLKLAFDREQIEIPHIHGASPIASSKRLQNTQN